MARQVYFDPYGSYTRGYDQGALQEQNLQQNVRQARDSDYKFNVLNPLELNKLQREDQLGVEAQPYRIKMLPLGYQNARNETAKGLFDVGYLGAQFGQNEPTAQALSFLTGRGYTMDPNGYLQFTDAMGNPYGPQLDQRGILNGYAPFRQETYGREDKAHDQQIDVGQLGVSQQNANTAEAAARANAQIGAENSEIKGELAAYKTGGGLPSFMRFDVDAPAGTAGNAFFGMGQPEPQAPVQYAPSPRAALPLPGQTNTSKDLVTWMQAANPHAPALTESDWDGLGPAGQQAYIRQWFPQMASQGYAAPVPGNPADYNPYTR